MRFFYFILAILISSLSVYRKTFRRVSGDIGMYMRSGSPFMITMPAGIHVYLVFDYAIRRYGSTSAPVTFSGVVSGGWFDRDRISSVRRRVERAWRLKSAYGSRPSIVTGGYLLELVGVRVVDCRIADYLFQIRVRVGNDYVLVSSLFHDSIDRSIMLDTPRRQFEAIVNEKTRGAMDSTRTTG